MDNHKHPPEQHQSLPQRQSARSVMVSHKLQPRPCPLSLKSVMVRRHSYTALSRANSSLGQIQAPTMAPITQIGDGQIQAPTAKPKTASAISQISDVSSILHMCERPLTQSRDNHKHHQRLLVQLRSSLTDNHKLLSQQQQHQLQANLQMVSHKLPSLLHQAPAPLPQPLPHQRWLRARAQVSFP